MARKPSAPGERMVSILAVMPDGEMIRQPDIYSALGYAEGAGATL